MDYRFHIVKVAVRVREYMNDFEPNDYEKFHTVDADTEDEAREKVSAFYEAKSDAYGKTYSATIIEFFEHIN